MVQVSVGKLQFTTLASKSPVYLLLEVVDNSGVVLLQKQCAPLPLKKITDFKEVLLPFFFELTLAAGVPLQSRWRCVSRYSCDGWCEISAFGELADTSDETLKAYCANYGLPRLCVIGSFGLQCSPGATNRMERLRDGEVRARSVQVDNACSERGRMMLSTDCILCFQIFKTGETATRMTPRIYSYTLSRATAGGLSEPRSAISTPQHT